MKNFEKKTYVELELKILSLNKLDVLTASDENDVASDPYTSNGTGNNWWD